MSERGHEAAPVDPESPWPGLRPFGEQAREYFFGREDELRELCERVCGRRVTVVFGPSGVGKSSVLAAGLLPSLRERGYLPVTFRAVHDPSDGCSVEEQLLTAISHAMLAEADHRLASGGDPSPAMTLGMRVAKFVYGTRAGLGGDRFSIAAEVRAGIRAVDATEPMAAAVARHYLWRLFHDPELGLAPANGADPSLPPVVLVLDQFEELYTLGERGGRRRASAEFLETIAQVVEDRPPPSVVEQLDSDDAFALRVNHRAAMLRVVIAIRADYLHVLERSRRAMPSIMDGRMEIRDLSYEQAIRAVRRPGAMRPGQAEIFGPAAAESIVRYVAEDGAIEDPSAPRVAPALLSLVCREINERRRRRKWGSVQHVRFGGRGASAVELSDSPFAATKDAVDVDLPAEERRGIVESFYESAFQVSSGSPSRNVLAAVRDVVEHQLVSGEGLRESMSEDSFLRALATSHRRRRTLGQRAFDGFEVLDHLTDRRRRFQPAIFAEVGHMALEHLIQRRLLVREVRRGTRFVELGHDILARAAARSRDEGDGRGRRWIREVWHSVGVAAVILVVVGAAHLFATAKLRLSANSALRQADDLRTDQAKIETDLGALLQAQGRLVESEPYLRDALKQRRRVLGDKHPDTLDSVSRVARLSVAQGKALEGLDLITPFEPAARKSLKGDNVRRLAEFLTVLGRARIGVGYDAGRFELAEANLLEAHSICVASTGPDPTHRDTIECVQALVDLYTAWDKSDPGKGFAAKAAEWGAKLPADGPA